MAKMMKHTNGWRIDYLRLSVHLHFGKGTGKQLLRFSIMPKILYRASKANWRLA
jgi:hypothetical protein